MATPAGAPPAAGAPAPSRPSNVPAAFVWDPNGLGGAGAWTAPPGAPQVAGGYVTIAADGKQYQSDAAGNTVPVKPVVTSGTDILSKVGGYASHPLDTLKSARTGITDALGITTPTPADLSKSQDAQNQRDFATQLRTQYGNIQPGTAQQVQATPLNTTQSDQARALANQNIAGLQGVASGATSTAADALLRQGTDAAQNQAMGLAAAYSRQNPGAALRQGLAAGQNAQNQATTVAAQQKANEQAQARGQIGSLADAMRGQDTQTAQANQQNQTEAQKANQSAGLQQQSVNNQYQLGLGGLANNATAGPLAAAYKSQEIQQQNTQANQQATGGFLSGAGKGIETIFSDREAKTDIKPTSYADALANNVHGVTFKYKPGIEDGGEHAGVIAQDIAKVFPGIVTKGSNGMQRVDTGHLALGLTGITAELAKRLRAVEGKRS